MENEWLKEALFRPGELLQGPEIRALIFLPMEGAPEPADVQMLERMLEAMSFVYLTLLIFGGTLMARFFARKVRLARLGNGLIGLFFMGFAARLATLSS